MPLRSRPAVGALLVALAAAGAGGLSACGSESSQVSDTSGTRLPGGGPRPVEAGFVFKDGALLPARLKVAAADSVIVVLSAADGRPHGVVLEGGGQRLHVLLRPSETVRRRLTGLTPGARVHVVPDGAAEPAVLQIG
jgi:hypothetical protein